MAYESPLPIIDVINSIYGNEYVLPSIQREFVWKTSQIERLFDSIMRGYPIGAFLFWELDDDQKAAYKFYAFLKNYHQKNAKHNPKIDLKGTKNVTAVLDGQQRLTSLFIGLKGSYAYKMPYKQWKSEGAFPERKLYLNLAEPAKNENDQYEFAFLTVEECINDQEHYWFEVGNILNMKKLGDIIKYIDEHIKQNHLYAQNQYIFAVDSLSQLFQVIHVQPSISAYKVQSDELDKVLNIFIRVNSGGTILSYSDLLLSIATAQWKNLDAREEIIALVNDLNDIGSGFNVNKDFILKAALVLSDFKDIAFKVDNFNQQNMLKIEQNWQVIKKSLQQTFLLLSSFGFSGKILNSNNAVIPIAYYLMTIGNPANFETSTHRAADHVKIKKWLIMSLLKSTFGGQPDSVLRPLREIIRKNGKQEFPLDEIIQELRGTNKSIIFSDDDIDHLLEYKFDKAETLTVLMLLYPSLDFSNHFHIDHIYPRGKFTKNILAKKGITEQKISEYMAHVNDLSNLQLLEAVANMEKQDTDFDLWFSSHCPTNVKKDKYRAMHYLPDMAYTYGNFELFLSERRKLLKSELEKMLK